MPAPKHNQLVYGLLLGVWLLVLGWQITEHFRVMDFVRAGLINRAKDISNTVGIVLRSQRHFGNVVTRERLESALAGLVKPDELNAIALLNAGGDVVAFAGSTNEIISFKGTAQPAELWEDETVTVLNLIDLGTNLTSDIEHTNPPIILSRQDFSKPTETNRPLPPPPSEPNPAETTLTNSADGTNSIVATNRSRSREGRPHFGRPPWMSEVDYKVMIEKQGVHSFVVVMSTRPVVIANRYDLWLRSIIMVLTTISVFGTGLAWRNLAKTSELQIRLVRASELNSHLKEMNLAAAGLAHETRNPLNIIRGIAQMLSKQDDASPVIRQKTREIIDEADRVTAQLNEFINYAKPREVRRSPLALNFIIAEVAHTLNYDLEEKYIQLKTSADISLTIEADEQLFRQTLFNLLLNAIQAVDKNGEIQVFTVKTSPTEAALEICDNGPGVAAEHRQDIFKPYFTTHQRGTGLGLAVVQQIVLAHGWDIAYVPNEPRGAVFRITHLKLVG